MAATWTAPEICVVEQSLYSRRGMKSDHPRKNVTATAGVDPDNRGKVAHRSVLRDFSVGVERRDITRRHLVLEGFVERTDRRTTALLASVWAKDAD